MPVELAHTDLFPDDTTVVPTSGSAEQAALLADEVEFGTEDFLDRLQEFSDLAAAFYDELMAACQNVVAEALPGRRLRVLDLCSGVGLVTLRLLGTELPIERVTLADLSPELMERARVILARRVDPNRLPPLETVEIDLLVTDLAERLAGPYDLVITSNAFQHFPSARQAELVRQIHDLLAPSGVFIFGSHFKLIRPAWKQALVDGYLQRMRQHGAPAPALAQVDSHMRHFHTYVNLREAYDWLAAAGFRFYECVFRKEEVGILVAVKFRSQA